MRYDTSTPERREKALQYRRDWYYRNRKKVIANNREYTKKNRKIISDWLINLKSTLKCETCGEPHPACLEFHHKEPEKKVKCIANCIRAGWNIDRIKTEISKCKVLCSNCHQKLHWAAKYET